MYRRKGTNSWNNNEDLNSDMVFTYQRELILTKNREFNNHTFNDTFLQVRGAAQFVQYEVITCIYIPIWITDILILSATYK